MYDVILEALKLGVWRQLDVQFAYTLIKSSLDNHNNQNFLILATIVLSAYINQGHVCLPLLMLTPDHIFHGSHCVLADQAWQRAGSLSIRQWQELLLTSNIVSDGSYLSPLVLDRGRLYLYRMWQHECSIASFFHSEPQKLINISTEQIDKIKKLLNKLFPDGGNSAGINQNKNNKIIDWQKIAVAVALTRKVTVISGAPGTGKTSVISKLLIIILLIHSNISLNIKLAAPTGKSVARLHESVNSMIEQLYSININYKQFNLSLETVTLHRLLGMSFDRQNHNRANYNFLFLDYLIIDESSMIDLFIMAKIIKCLSSKTKIVFLGDHNQLPSVEPGAIFSDICYFIEGGYTFDFCQQIKNLTNCIVPCNNKNKYNFSDNFCLLHKNYRFDSISEIGKLANAINENNCYLALSLLTSKSNTDISYVVLKNRNDYFRMLFDCALGYLNYLKSLRFYTCIHLKSILSMFKRYRILSVLKDGPFGVARLNFLIENILRDKGLIHINSGDNNYIGRPIIITSNDPSLFLFNGDTGIILPDNSNDINNNKKLFAYFLSSDENIKKIALYRLPKHETNFVMTIHKSQGSEFEHVVLIFPEKITSILTRELFYTGITRARKRLSIYANNEILNYTISNSYKRYSGLIDRLMDFDRR